MDNQKLSELFWGPENNSGMVPLDIPEQLKRTNHHMLSELFGGSENNAGMVSQESPEQIKATIPKCSHNNLGERGGF